MVVVVIGGTDALTNIAEGIPFQTSYHSPPSVA
jgi:hypothetical protein